jgi:hypothetical protein
VSASSCNLERLGLFALLVNVNQLTWLHAERWAVDALTVNKDVTVHNQLSCLGDCASKSSAQNNGVKTHLEKFNQVLTG